MAPRGAQLDSPGATQAELPDDSDEEIALSWLRTEGPFIVDAAGRSISLRGVSVNLPDDLQIPDGGLLRDQLELDDARLDALQNLWGVNLIQLRVGMATLTGTGAIASSDLLSGLADLVTALSTAGMYLLLSLTLEPSAPDPTLLDAWAAFAEPFDATPEVLFELVAPGAAAASWLGAAPQLVGAVRRVHPAALIFVGVGPGGAGLSGLPLSFTTGAEIHNIVYSAALDPGLLALGAGDALSGFAADHPLFISSWAGQSDPFDRSVDAAMLLLERWAIGWSASGWNSEPRLVEANGAATRWGRDVQRAMVRPLRERIEQKLPDTPPLDEPRYPPDWPTP
jgi:hypothetical protein